MEPMYGKNKVLWYPLEELIFFRPLSRFLAKLLSKTKIHPNYISMFGLLSTLGTSILIVAIYPIIGLRSKLYIAVALYVAYLLDKTDGDLARLKGLASVRGAYLDSFLDRIGEVMLFIAFVIATGFSNILLVGLTIAGPLIFYTHMFMFWYYASGEPSFFPTGSMLTRRIKNLIAYNRTKHFILLIVLVMIGRLEYSFFIFPWLIPYTFLLFLVLMIFDKRLSAITFQKRDRS